jgi:antitoxin HicB
MHYPAIFTPAPEGGFVVTFRDIPEAITQGDDEAEALAMSAEVLLSAMDVYFDEKRPVPMPSKPKAGERIVSLPASAWAKVLLLNEMLIQGIRPSELARRIGCTPQDANRLINLNHNTKLDSIATAIAALGKTLDIRII